MDTKAFGYVRVSSDRQEQEGFSIPAQIKLLKEYALKNGINLVKIFEETQSAKQAGRGEFLKMLQEVSKGEVKTILVEKTDRIYRNMKDYTNLDIEANDLELHLIKENEIISKNSKSHQKFIHGIKVLMAKNYSDNLSEEVKKGSREKAAQGWYPSPAPIGYINQDKIIKIDPDRGYLVRKIFELTASGDYSLRKLAQVALSMGLKSKKNTKISHSRIQGLLQNVFYYGEFDYGGQRYVGKHEPLISYSLFQKANEAMGYNQKPKNNNLYFAFGNLMSCSHCGCSVTAERKVKKSGREYIYYHCTNGKGVCDNQFYLNETKVEEIIAGALSKLKLSKEIIDWTKNAIEASYGEENDFRQKEVSRLQARYKQIESLQDKMYDDKLEGKITEAFWQDRYQKYQAEQTDILERLKRLDAAADDFKYDTIELMELARKASQLFKEGTPEEKRKIAKLVLSNPVFKNGSIEYGYEKPFDHFVNVVELNEWRAKWDAFRTIILGLKNCS